jgi:outer membrane protein TolC
MGLERPDLRALREDVAQANAQVDQARAARRPQISLRGSTLFRIPETLLGGFAWSLGASILQSIFDGGRNRAKVEAARAERSRRAATLAQGERDMEAQVEQARLTLDAAEKRLAAEDRRVAAAVEALEIARVRLRAGTIAPFEVTEVQTSLVRAQTDAIAARFEVARARANLAFVTGVAYPESVPQLIAAAP